MNLSLGMKAQIRSMVFVAGEPIPNFWPMRAFIHHNPLHGLERLPFEQAVAEGRRLFHGAGFLPRTEYQRYYRQGSIDPRALYTGIETLVRQQSAIDGIDLQTWLTALLTQVETPIFTPKYTVRVEDIGAVLRGDTMPDAREPDAVRLADQMSAVLLKERPLYEALDLLYGTGIGEELDELVVKSCLDFFDEGQSVWQMPHREKGFFSAWREVAQRNVRLFLWGRQMRETLAASNEPEGIIVHVMESLEVPREHWMKYFRRELARLHGWAGFIRWRSTARHYHQGRCYPGDLVDFLAIRLTLALSIIRERGQHGIPRSTEQLQGFIRKHPAEACLRHEFFSKRVLPAWAQRVESALLTRNHGRIEQLYLDYRDEKRVQGAAAQAVSLRQLADQAGASSAIQHLSNESLGKLIAALQACEEQEGMLWLEAMENSAMDRLLQDIRLEPPAPREKRPFAQALFCIDTRSERLRRHLEGVGDYQTFGIAGFFGVPVSFMELGKGSETHLCPVLLTPKNLVMEMSVDGVQDPIAVSAIEKALHELKESVLTPFVTVEAIGLLFGLDMVGKTLAPSTYNRWRSRLHNHKPHTHLLIDKLSREQADSIVRAVQRAVIAKAVEHELDVLPEHINDDLIRELREAALGHAEDTPLFRQQLQLAEDKADSFVIRLRSAYRINTPDSRVQMERLGRIGFSLDEQVVFVSQALHAIGMTKAFSRFVLVVGHGSQSENNPYESALDCGACGGNLGLVNARIFANMANKAAVRQRLQQQGIHIPDDAWFIPALHNTTTDEVSLYGLDQLPSSHPVYLDRLHNGLIAASRLCAQERLPTLDSGSENITPAEAGKRVMRNAMDWSQVRPEWGLSRNAYFIIGRRSLTDQFSLDGRAFLHSYDYRVDRKLRLLENIMTGPLVVGQWINMEHYFSTVDNERYGSGSKVYHNVAGRFGVMTGNLSDLRTGLPAQTVLSGGRPYHEPMRLITVIEAPFQHVLSAIDRVAVIRRLLNNGWIRILVVDPETRKIHVHCKQQWQEHHVPSSAGQLTDREAIAL